MAKPEAKIVKQVNGHTMTMSRHSGRWFFSSPWPELAREHDGCEDTAKAVAEFERRALAGTQPSLFVQEVVE